MEVIFLLILGAVLAALLHKEPETTDNKKTDEEKPKKPEIRTFQLEKITRTTKDGEEVYIKEVTPVVPNYPVAWTESDNHRG